MKRLLLPLALLAALALSVSSAHALTYSQLVKVSTCKASLNVSTFYGSSWGYGYYPRFGYPYYWPSVYGHMYYEPAITSTNPELGIDYTNISPKVMREIEFGLVAHGLLVAEVKDVGKFSPGAEIKHRFGVSDSIFPLPTAMTECVPLRITFMDGTTWTSPHLPRLKHPLGEPD